MIGTQAILPQSMRPAVAGGSGGGGPSQGPGPRPGPGPAIGSPSPVGGGPSQGDVGSSAVSHSAVQPPNTTPTTISPAGSQHSPSASSLPVPTASPFSASSISSPHNTKYDGVGSGVPLLSDRLGYTVNRTYPQLKS
eukprot:TRINITY_DN15006_c0_g1_i1.p1 TRINITY_DN15006_c0_g1~~TRINITY_DN15006_c0_g1_i1.p1  ORF type:complete len:137 (+),score=16.79 TRINITY_DN15006_c0_g1_i1:302-712(+)